PTPQSTMPTMAKLTAVSGQTAKLSQGDASQHTNRLASTARQNETAAAHTEEAMGEEALAAATLAGNPEDAGAAFDTGAGERAPVEITAASADQTRGPHPAESGRSEPEL
ncbi:hypothetical protein SKC42_26150, partial [Mycobacterium sp. 050134]